MSSPFDTIVAPITGTAPAAVAIVRISGAEAWEVASKVFANWPEPPESHKAVYGRYSTGDDGLALPFAEGHSYTGEQSVELSCHGSPQSVRALVLECTKAGAREARPGEFTERAFLNGRMDLTEAEAVADTVNALTEAQLKMANRQREGALHKAVEELRARVLKVLAAVEATVDFEEEIGPLDAESTVSELRQIHDSIENILKNSDLGRIMRHGLRVAIIGPPNVGKSSLFNAIVGYQRAIVTPVEGTTRDYIEETISVSGIPITLIDTAGLRDSDDPVESIGIQRSIAQAASADLTWYVFEATRPEFPGFFDAPQTFGIANKADLVPPEHRVLGDRMPYVSAKTGEGIGGLLNVFTRLAEKAAALQVPPPNERHAERLRVACTCVSDAIGVLQEGLPTDLLSTLLRGAANHLGEITGETASADMIDRIFADFCIGK